MAVSVAPPHSAASSFSTPSEPTPATAAGEEEDIPLTRRATTAQPRPKAIPVTVSIAPGKPVVVTAAAAGPKQTAAGQPRHADDGGFGGSTFAGSNGGLHATQPRQSQPHDSSASTAQSQTSSFGSHSAGQAVVAPSSSTATATVTVQAQQAEQPEEQQAQEEEYSYDEYVQYYIGQGYTQGQAQEYAAYYTRINALKVCARRSPWV